MNTPTKVIWREWLNKAAVEMMQNFRTLPREEIKLDTRGMDGPEVAEAIAKAETENGSEFFRDGPTSIVIVEPAEFAGTYTVHVDYDPTFKAFREDLD